MRVAVDMDEVISDTNAAKRALYGRLCDRSWSDEDLRGRHMSELAASDETALVEQELHSGLPFGGFAPVEGAVEVLRLLADEHEIFIATAAMDYPASCIHKIAWVERHFPFIPRQRIVLCGDKSVVRADVLIDDSARHFEGFVGHGILFSAPHNAGVDWPNRIDHWHEAPEMIGRLDAARAA